MIIRHLCILLPIPTDLHIDCVTFAVALFYQDGDVDLHIDCVTFAVVLFYQYGDVNLSKC